MKKLVALHKHWCTADSIKQFISAPIPEPKEPTAEPQLPVAVLQLAQQHSMFMRLSVWYALLYVVIEGYRDLEQKDSAIEELLAQSEKVDALRRFRNATFHYQEDPFSEKLLGFLEAKESEVWIRQLNSAFKSFFERALPIKELLAAIAERAPNIMAERDAS